MNQVYYTKIFNSKAELQAEMRIKPYFKTYAALHNGFLRHC